MKKVLLLIALLANTIFSTISNGQAPIITSFSPTNGPVGTSVTINGTGFNSTPSNNVVYFGATRSTVTSATATRLMVTVPTGASYQSIIVQANGLTSYSKIPFSTTYTGWGIVDASSFVPKVDFATGTNPNSAALGDLDGDGKLDMAVVNYNYNGSNGTVSVYRNTSTGAGAVNYAANVDYATGSHPYSVALSDLDGDGKLDIAVANFYENSVSVYRNTSTGAGTISFDGSVSITTGITTLGPMAVGDMDGDGKVDMAVITASNTVTMLRNTSTGVGIVSFAASGTLTSTGYNPSSVTLGDLDGDGKLDMALTNYDNNSISVCLNTSTGAGTVSFAASVTLTTGSNPYSVGLGDLDGDGKMDMAVTNYNSNTVSLYRNTSTVASALSFAASGNLTTGGNPYSVGLGDLDGDGKVDMAVTNYNSNTVSLYRNTSTGTGAVSYATKMDYATGTHPKSVAIGDMDGDGKSDMAVTNYGGNTASIIRHELLNGQTITFNPIPNKSLGDASFHLGAISSSGLSITYTSSNTSVATISGDMVTIVGNGNCSITAAQPGNSAYCAAVSVSQLLYVGPPPSISNFTPASGPVGTVVTINGTGFSPTLVNNIVYFGATRATVTSGSTTQLKVTVPVGASYQPITVQVNGLTGYSGIAFSTTYPGWGWVDASSFVPRVNFHSEKLPGQVALGDLDGDGKVDMVVVNDYNFSNTVSVFRNTSSGTGAVSYADKVDFTVGSKQGSVALGDMDGDGKLDMAVTSSNTVSLYLNTSTAGTVSFTPRVDIPTGNSPVSIALGDLDRDGKVDMAVANAGNTISVYRNTSIAAGIVSFASKVDFTTGPGPQSIALGDLDKDGKVDVVVVNNDNYNGNTFSVLRNTSTGAGIMSFAAKVDYATGTIPMSIALGDMDGDGKLDIALTKYASTVSVYRNTSTGAGAVSYAASVDYPTGPSPYLVTLGDMDGDGKVDMVVAHSYYNTTVSVYHNTSTGIGTVSYAAKVDFSGGATAAVAIGDIDGDGKSDIAVSSDGNIVSVIRHELLTGQTITFNPIPNKLLGNATFSPATASSGLPIIYTSSDLNVATGGSAITIVGRGTCTITAAQPGNSTYAAAVSISQLLSVVGPTPAITSFTPISGPVGTAVTINGTGFSPLASNNIVYFGAVRATVTSASLTQLTVIVPVGATYQPITVENLLVGSSRIPFSTTYPQWGVVNATSFLPKVDFSTGANPNSVALALGDMDVDGKVDMAVTNAFINTVAVHRSIGTGPGTLDYRWYPYYFGTGNNPRSGTLGDIDGDGKMDVAVANSVSNTVSVSLNTSNGVVNYEVTFAPKLDFITGSNPQFVALGDIDGDGRLDMAVANYSSNTVSIFRNTSTGAGTVSYAAKVDFVTGTNPGSIALGDMDGDGKVDMAVANYGNNTISVYRNTSTGPGVVSYAARVNFATGTGPQFIALGDMDTDGKLDMAVANSGSNSVSVYRNTSIGTGAVSYSTKVDYTTGNSPQSVALGDMDGDGKADMAVANNTSNTVSVYQNTSLGAGNVNYATKVDFTTGVGPRSVSIGDMDGDGMADLVALQEYTFSIIRHQNALSQTITFNALPSKTYGDAPSTLSASASSGLAVTYSSSNTSVAMVSGNTVTIVGAGTAIITASQAGGGGFTPAQPVSQLLTVNKADQTITLNLYPIQCGLGTFTLNAIATSGLPISFSSSNLGVATISGNTVNVVGYGSTDITAAQSGNENYNPATSVTKTLTVISSLPVIPTITTSGPTAFCQGGSVTLTSSAASSYLWSTGAATQSITATKSGNYSVKVTDSNGCLVTSAIDSVTVVSSKILIMASDGFDLCTTTETTLTATAIAGASSYSWSLSSGEFLATGQSLTVYGAATYVVKATIPVCGEMTASARTTQDCTIDPPPCLHPPCPAVRVSGHYTPEEADLPTVKEMTAFPNPAIDKVTVAMPSVAKQDTPVSLYNMFGDLLINGTLKKGEWKTELLVTNCSEGLHIVRVGNGALINAVKVMVVHK